MVSQAIIKPTPASPPESAGTDRPPDCPTCSTIREAINGSAHGFSVFDADGRLVICNARLRELFGLPEDFAPPSATMEALFRHMARTGELGPGDPETHVRRVLQEMTSGRSRTFERERPNGDILEIEICHMPSGGHLAVITDVTRERHAESRLKRHIDDLQFARTAMERQNVELIRLAEELTAQKQIAEAAKAHSDYLAAHETLTGLPNRRTLIERLHDEVQDLATDERLALLFVDLDRFKQINDTLGHERGDAHLVEVARRLRATASEEHFVARLGGDEFAVLVRLRCDDADAALHHIAEQFLAALQISVKGRGGRIATGASIGGAIYPDQAGSASELLAFADASMYRAKKAGGNRVALFGDP